MNAVMEAAFQEELSDLRNNKMNREKTYFPLRLERAAVDFHSSIVPAGPSPRPPSQPNGRPPRGRKKGKGGRGGGARSTRRKFLPTPSPAATQGGGSGSGSGGDGGGGGDGDGGGDGGGGAGPAGSSTDNEDDEGGYEDDFHDDDVAVDEGLVHEEMTNLLINQYTRTTRAEQARQTSQTRQSKAVRALGAARKRGKALRAENDELRRAFEDQARELEEATRMVQVADTALENERRASVRAKRGFEQHKRRVRGELEDLREAMGQIRRDNRQLLAARQEGQGGGAARGGEASGGSGSGSAGGAAGGATGGATRGHVRDMKGAAAMVEAANLATMRLMEQVASQREDIQLLRRQARDAGLHGYGVPPRPARPTPRRPHTSHTEGGASGCRGGGGRGGRRTTTPSSSMRQQRQQQQQQQRQQQRPPRSQAGGRRNNRQRPASHHGGGGGGGSRGGGNGLLVSAPSPADAGSWDDDVLHNAEVNQTKGDSSRMSLASEIECQSNGHYVSHRIRRAYEELLGRGEEERRNRGGRCSC